MRHDYWLIHLQFTRKRRNALWPQQSHREGSFDRNAQQNIHRVVNEVKITNGMQWNSGKYEYDVP